MASTTAPAAPSLPDWSAEFRGVVIGAPDSPFAFTAISGLLDAPAVRTADRRALARHGEASGRDYLSARTVTLTMEVNAQSLTEFADALDALSAAFAPARDPAPFTFRFPGVAGGGLRQITAKVRKRTAAIDAAYTNAYATMDVELYCPSPLIRDVATETGRARLPNPNRSGGGVVFPQQFPIRFGSVPSPETVRVHNKGNADAFPQFRISGPVSFPRIVNIWTGEQIEFRYTLLAGQWLDIDMDAREVLLNGSAPRFLTPGRRNTWLTARPGVTEFEFRGFRIPDAAGEPELTGAWASTWA